MDSMPDREVGRLSPSQNLVAEVRSTRIAAYFGHLFEVATERWPIDELAQRRPDDPATRCLNRRAI